MIELLRIFANETDRHEGAWRVWLIWFARSSFVAIFALITVASLVSGDVGDVEEYGLDDKVAHILAYLSIMGACNFSTRDLRLRLSLFLALLAYGFALEVGQALWAEGRQGGIDDLAANITGLVLGILLSKPMGHLFAWVGPKLAPNRGAA